MPHDVRDQVMDFVRRWSEKSEIGVGRFIAWLGVSTSKFYDWRERYGCVNEHNGWIPRDFWLELWEKEAIIFRCSSTRYHLWGTCASPGCTTPDFKLTGLLGACVEGASSRPQSFFAKLSLFLMLFAGTLPKSFSFPVNIYERIYILLAFHAFTPAKDSTLLDKRIGSSATRSHVPNFTIGSHWRM